MFWWYTTMKYYVRSIYYFSDDLRERRERPLEKTRGIKRYVWSIMFFMNGGLTRQLPLNFNHYLYESHMQWYHSNLIYEWEYPVKLIFTLFIQHFKRRLFLHWSFPNLFMKKLSRRLLEIHKDSLDFIARDPRV